MSKCLKKLSRDNCCQGNSGKKSYFSFSNTMYIFLLGTRLLALRYRLGQNSSDCEETTQTHIYWKVRYWGRNVGTKIVTSY